MNSGVIEKDEKFLSCILAAMLLLASTHTHAAPGVLSDMPLFLAHPVQPNIFFLLDNSGSMDWEVMMSAGAKALYPAGVDEDPDGNKNPDFYNQGNLTFKPGTDERGNLEHCAGFNVLAYDPLKTYTPWYGKDKDGVEFADQTITNARVNPYTGGSSEGSCTGMFDSDESEAGVKLEEWVDNSNGVVCDLTRIENDGAMLGKQGAFYYPWYDHNKDGIYQDGECSKTGDVAFRVSDRQYVADLPTEKERTNYANWFSYYRKREYVMKRAVSQIIAESRDRLGLATINKSDIDLDGGKEWSDTNMHITKHTHVGTQVKDMDDLTLPANPIAASNKETLMDNLLGVNSHGGTPLRTSLDCTGRYFAGTMTTAELFGYVPENDENSALASSPILNAEHGGICQQNFVVLLSDGYWNQKIDGITPAGNADSNSNNPFDGQSYADDYQNTLADFAMKYYKTDLMPRLDNKVPAVSIYPGADKDQSCYDDTDKESKLQNCFDINDNQHLVTFTVSFGVVGAIPEKYPDGRECYPHNRHEDLATQNWPKDCGADFNGWPEIVSDEATTADDMKHAAWNGRGQFLNAKTPDELINQLQQTIGMISQRKTVSASAVALESFNVINGGKVYQGRFDAAKWTGQLFANNIETVNKVTKITDQVWAAHEKLDVMDINQRILVTYNGTKGLDFSFPADYTTATNPGTTELSADQVADLLHKAPHDLSTEVEAEIAENQAYGERLVAYLRGDKENEGTSITQFRIRDHRLGDIIHSSPVYVGDPDPELYPSTINPLTEPPYSQWASNPPDDERPGAKGRQPMVYVGANDGALHAFDAKTGIEKFAYFPQAVFSDEDRQGLHWLANPAYEHRYYVDMEPAVAEIYDSAEKTWKTLLVGGLRGGGKAIYAIDISDPTEFNSATDVAGNILWEYTNDKLGYTYSKPTIAKLNNGHWAAIFGNGYNQSGEDADGWAALFIKYLDIPGEEILTTKGTNDASLITPGGDCLTSGSDCNGLSTPAVVDLGADRVADRVYAGDIKGNMWAFDISSNDPAEWKVAYGDAQSPLPLFKATDGKNAQPITSQPMVTQHPTNRHSDTSPNTMVFFGTGQYIVEGDSKNNGTNTFYGIWDAGAPVALDRSATSPVLVEQTVGDDPSELSGSRVRLMTNNPLNYVEHKGWFFDLPEEGERVIVNPLVFGDLIIYSTIVPSSNLCSDSAGHSWLMVHNLADGSEPDFIAMDVNGDGTFDHDDQVGDDNAAGKMSDNFNWQSSPGKTGPGATGTFLQPNDGEGPGISQVGIRGAAYKGSRSSWGLLRHD